VSGPVLLASRWHRAVVAAVAAAVVVAAIVAVRGQGGGTTVVAHFPEAKGIYVGDDVTLLGVRVGSIRDIEITPDHVEVEMRIDEGVTLPADVKAAIAAPALVTVRSIALAPAFSGGPTMKSGGVIPLSRTSVPVEWDEVKRQITRLSKALGPRGANRDGPLARMVSSGARFLAGSGASMNQTISDIAVAMETLADNKGDLFATVRNLQVFVTALRSSDAQIRSFNRRLDVVAAALDTDRGLVAGALDGLSSSFIEVQRFLRRHRNLTVSTLEELRSTTREFAEHRQGMADILHLAPTALSNFYNIIDPRVGANTGVLAAQNLYYPAQIICSAILNLNGRAEDCAAALAPLVDFLKIDAPPTGFLPPVAISDSTGPSGSPGQESLDELLSLLPENVLKHPERLGGVSQ